MPLRSNAGRETPSFSCFEWFLGHEVPQMDDDTANRGKYEFILKILAVPTDIGINSYCKAKREAAEATSSSLVLQNSVL